MTIVMIEEGSSEFVVIRGGEDPSDVIFMMIHCRVT